MMQTATAVQHLNLHPQIHNSHHNHMPLHTHHNVSRHLNGSAQNQQNQQLQYPLNTSSSSTTAATATARQLLQQQQLLSDNPTTSTSTRNNLIHPSTNSNISLQMGPSTSTIAPASAISSGTLTRKRKRPTHQYSVTYSEVQEFDHDGRLREVIVIDDTPPPPTMSPAASTSVSISTTHRNGYSTASYQPPAYHAPIRTRARAAAEASALSGVPVVLPAPGSHTISHAHSLAQGPLQKKRKRDVADDGQPIAVASSSKKVVTGGNKALNNVVTTKSYSGATTEDASKGPPPCDDKEGHYIIVPDDLIYRRYRTIKLLGQGTFGKVVEAVDTTNQQRVAIKIIRAIPKYRDASKIEIRVLQRLKDRDPLNRNKCIHLLHFFDHKNHVCLVSELLGMCIYDFLKENEFQPFPRRHIQEFAKQLLGSVAFLHELRLIHTDLKPENILLVKNAFRTIYVASSKRNAPPRPKKILSDTDIRLIDFGSATFEEEYHSTVVSTRHYRAPEIILGLGWSFPCDVFSLGCILVEFYTGVALFQTHDNLEHLAMMENVMGRMPERVVRAGARSKPEFFRGADGAGSVGGSVGAVGGSGSRLDWPKPKASRQSKKDVRGVRKLQDLIPPRDTVNMYFLDLVQKLLAFDPEQRLSVRQALEHPYFKIDVPLEE